MVAQPMIGADTICAVATPPGVGGIAVIRISGPRAIEVTDAVWRGKRLALCESHTVHLGHIIDPEAGGEPLDQAVATIYRAPRSYTGLDTVELSFHGSEYLQHAIPALLCAHGARMAEAGEFTRLAFLSGNIDLTRAEAVADIIASQSRAEARVAAKQLDGAISARITELRDKLLEMASLLELELDFSEEEDARFASRPDMLCNAVALHKEISYLLATYSCGNAMRRGLTVAITGAPNAGKSTLLNALAGSRRAIVSDTPGTTRDIVTHTLNIGDHLVTLTDTAGIRPDTPDAIEAAGIEAARQAAAEATIVLRLSAPGIPYPSDLQLPPNVAVIDVATKADILPGTADLLPATSELHPATANLHRATADNASITVSAATGQGLNDLLNAINVSAATGQGLDELRNAIHVSAATGQGLDELRKAIEKACDEATGNNLRPDILTNARHADILSRALVPLTRLIAALTPTPLSNPSDPSDPSDLSDLSDSSDSSDLSDSSDISVSAGSAEISGELLAMDLRETLDTLAEITGEITTPDILNTIFSRFCIGK